MLTEISIFLLKQNDILNDLQLRNKYSNLHFFFKCAFRLVKLPLSLAAHPPTPWTPGKVQFVSTLKQQTLTQICVLGRRGAVSQLAYFSFKTGVFALKNSYLMQNNLHLKYMSRNVQQSIDTEWHEFILFTSVYYITNTLLVKFQCI